MVCLYNVVVSMYTWYAGGSLCVGVSLHGALVCPWCVGVPLICRCCTPSWCVGGVLLCFCMSVCL